MLRTVVQMVDVPVLVVEESGGRSDHSQVFLGAYYRTDCQCGASDFGTDCPGGVVDECNSGSSSIRGSVHSTDYGGYGCFYARLCWTGHGLQAHITEK